MGLEAFEVGLEVVEGRKEPMRIHVHRGCTSGVEVKALTDDQHRVSTNMDAFTAPKHEYKIECFTVQQSSMNTRTNTRWDALQSSI